MCCPRATQSERSPLPSRGAPRAADGGGCSEGPAEDFGALFCALDFEIRGWRPKAGRRKCSGGAPLGVGIRPEPSRDSARERSMSQARKLLRFSSMTDPNILRRPGPHTRRVVKTSRRRLRSRVPKRLPAKCRRGDAAFRGKQYEWTRRAYRRDETDRCSRTGVARVNMSPAGARNRLERLRRERCRQARLWAIDIRVFCATDGSLSPPARCDAP